jgi:nucleoid-associated protein YgaU
VGKVVGTSGAARDRIAPQYQGASKQRTLPETTVETQEKAGSSAFAPAQAQPALPTSRSSIVEPAEKTERKASAPAKNAPSKAVAKPAQPKPAADRANAKAKPPVPPTLGERFKRWLNPVETVASDRRRAHRRYVPGMVAHYYTGGAPKPHEIADISMSGMYILTEDRWMPETMIQMTLQKPCARGERKQSIMVLSRVVRRGSDGVATEFVMPENLDPLSHDIQPSQATDKFSLARFI